MRRSSLQGNARSTPVSIDLTGQGRIAGRLPVAVVDIGSNSVRLVIYEGNSRAPVQLFNEKILSGLGKGLARTGRLDDKSVASALSALTRFRALAELAGCTEIYPLATAAAREASNGAEFIKAATVAIGRDIIILSGADEARYAAEGVVAGFFAPNGIVGDLGGGSLELVEVSSGRFGTGLTTPLGGLRLRDLSGGDIARARAIADGEIGGSALAGACDGKSFYAVGGTWRNLAKLHMEQTRYPLQVMHGYRVAVAELADFLDKVATSDPEKLPGIDAVSRSRRSLLPFGAVTLQSVIANLKPVDIVVSAYGVREGYLHALLPEAELEKDALLVTARELSVLRSRSPIHNEELVRFAADTFHALGIDETPEEERLRDAACLLADVSWRAHPDYRGGQALSFTVHAALPALDHAGRTFLGLTNYFRYEGHFEQGMMPDLERLIPPRMLQRARVLASLFRVVFLLTAAIPGVLGKLRWVQDPRGGFTLAVPADLADLLGERPRARFQQFAKVVERTLRIEVR
ncbi:Ppx/GppA phosphatase family protein [Aureimonas altamirensis]|uniref:Ppx/GppA phosphatase family protein n=1 Tax=Aureimonas altamirensis TaxID=370622 RepID=UPI0009DFD3F9|nr:Ppx/GppA phosphatase family protein [Aureimonas altamirensis]